MALSNTDRVRDFRNRKKKERKVAADDVADIASTPFFEFWQSRQNIWSEADESLASVGVVAPTFDDDSDLDWQEEWAAFGDTYRGSIGRAERMVGAFLDSAGALARIINEYKREEITRAITKLEQSDLSDPAVRTKALAEIVRLTKLRDRLDKQVRWSLPEWKVKGD
ncbi:MAG: hypothetical protein M9939_20550 [Mesorhizobium sp.]|nr:hypothetical protein [Mesorhizobium sp.]MCO5163528.1 hypothetical protein [Mesorhizobium sp.]